MKVMNMVPTKIAVTAVLTVLLTACGSTAVNRAPVEDRNAARSVAPAPSAAPVAEASAPKLLPGQENAGKPGYYTVKAGDTLIRIGLDQGQNWRDIARWNNLERPYTIEIGQVLRVAPPPGAVASSTVVGKPLPPAGAAPSPNPSPTYLPMGPLPAPLKNQAMSPLPMTSPLPGRSTGRWWLVLMK